MHFSEKRNLNFNMNLMQKKSRIASLDGWRAISIVLVLLSHEWATTNAPRFEYPLSVLFSQGSLGVRIFFVISGYIITHLMICEVSVTGVFNLREFYIRRAFRIFPVYFLFLSALVVMQGIGLFHDAFTSWLGSLTFTRNIFGHGDSPTSHLWSLAVEEQFYLVWPLIFYALGLARHRRLAITILSTVIFTAFFIRLFHCSGNDFVCQRLLGEKSALRFMDCLAIGSLGAFIVDALPRIRWLKRKHMINVVSIVATFALVISAIIIPETDVERSSLLLVQSLLTIVAVCATSKGGSWQFH